jgi:asparagine synthase (glutamine-hydrolysing)
VRQGLGKYLLRRWLAGQVRSAQPMSKKRGFTVPVGEWIARRGAQLAPLVAAQPAVQEICLPNMVEKLFREASGKREGFAAWTLLFYALWHRHHIQRLPTATDVFTALVARG